MTLIEMSATPRFSVIIPAHDEAGGIARTLGTIQGGQGESEGEVDGRPSEVIVVCNACSDDTAEIARAAMPMARVIELGEGGKWRALNAGMALAREEIVIVVDADVEIGPLELGALARRLQRANVWAASPAVVFDLSDTDNWVRAYYKVFARHPYLVNGVGGAGVYGLSRRGRDCVGAFPRLMSDDGYVRARIPPRYQRRVMHEIDGRKIRARVRPPRTLAALLQVEARWRQGDLELQDHVAGPLRPKPQHPLWGLLAAGKVRRRDALRYLAIKLTGRMLRTMTRLDPERTWTKDHSSRQG